MFEKTSVENCRFLEKWSIEMIKGVCLIQCKTVTADSELAEFGWIRQMKCPDVGSLICVDQSRLEVSSINLQQRRCITDPKSSYLQWMCLPSKS